MTVNGDRILPVEAGLRSPRVEWSRTVLVQELIIHKHAL